MLFSTLTRIIYLRTDRMYIFDRCCFFSVVLEIFDSIKLAYLYVTGKEFLLTTLMKLAIISASWGARVVWRGNLTPDAIWRVQTPARVEPTETISSRGSVSRIDRSPDWFLLISRSPWWETATCCASGCWGPICNIKIYVIFLYFYLNKKTLR